MLLLLVYSKHISATYTHRKAKLILDDTKVNIEIPRDDIDKNNCTMTLNVLHTMMIHTYTD